MNIIPAIDRFINKRMYHYALLINGCKFRPNGVVIPK